jgi:hypothetical protein
MAASLLEAIFLPMLLQPDFSFGRVVVRNVLLKLSTRLVSAHLEDSGILPEGPHSQQFAHSTDHYFTDCPEREATYIITTGGINDPDKA